MSKILFVDDEVAVLRGLKRRLRDKVNEWEMEFVDNPASGIELVNTNSIDVVVADMAMPGLSGIEMIKEMRNRVGHTRYLMLTGKADVQTAVSAINEAKVSRFFTKPVETAHLVEGIESALLEIATEKVLKSSARSTDDIGTAGLAALNHLSVAVIVTDREARVRFSNSVGSILLAEQDGLTLSGKDICRAAEVNDTNTLHSLISSVCDGVDETETPALSLSRPSGRRPLSAVVRPISDSNSGHDAYEPSPNLAALYISDPERRPPPSPKIVALHFGLTPAEARLVCALANGGAMDDAAKTCGVTIATARSYLKQIFQKTGTNKQPELVKLIMTSPSLHQG